MFPTIYGILSQLGLSFLLRDDFTTPEAAPIASPRTAEPGPGTLTIVDTGNHISIASQEMVFSSGGLDRNPGIYNTSFARSVGLASLVDFRDVNVGFQRFGMGWGASGVVSQGELFFRQTGDFYYNGVSTILGSWVANSSYTAASIMQSMGNLIVLKNGGDWELVWVSHDSTTPMTTSFNGWDGNVNVDTFRVAQLSAPWDTDNGIATDVHAGNVTAGTTFAHEADCLIEWTQTTVPSAGTQELWFRSPSVGVDGWRVTVDSTGALSLDEVVSSVPTNRGTAAGVIANGDRIVIVADDETIKVYEANTLRITYASAVTNKTATAGELETLATGGAIADLISWPRVLSGAAKSALDEMAA